MDYGGNENQDCEHYQCGNHGTQSSDRKMETHPGTVYGRLSNSAEQVDNSRITALLRNNLRSIG